MRAPQTNPMPAVIPFKLADISLAPGNLAARGSPRPAGRRPNTPGPLLPMDVLLHLHLHLFIQLGAGAGDPTRQEIGTDESGITLPDTVRSGSGGILLRDGVWMNIIGVKGDGEVLVYSEIQEFTEVPEIGGWVLHFLGNPRVWRWLRS